MFRQVLLVAAGWAAIAGSVQAQPLERTASFLNGGSPGGGKCTIGIVVDAATEVEIRGNRAILRNLAGQPPQWRQFACTDALPQNPANFQFAGTSGRGRQVLFSDPRNNGGAAVIRIEDPADGAGTYTFDIMWGGGFAQGQNRNGQGGGRFGGGPGRRFTTEQAVQVCESSIRQQAEQQLRTRSITFRGTTLDDNPGRQDWVIGRFDIQRPMAARETYSFSCSVNFDTGQVRSAQIGPREGNR
jgi:hypothetical protein